MQKVVFNPFTNNFDFIEYIPQLDADPAAPSPEEAWVRRTVTGMGGGGGELKFLFGGGTAITDSGATSTTYQLSYRTLQNTTVRVTLT